MNSNRVMIVLMCLLMNPVLADGSAGDALFTAYQKMLDSRYVADTVSTDAKGRQTRSSAATAADVPIADAGDYFTGCAFAL